MKSHIRNSKFIWGGVVGVLGELLLGTDNSSARIKKFLAKRFLNVSRMLLRVFLGEFYVTFIKILRRIKTKQIR